MLRRLFAACLFSLAGSSFLFAVSVTRGPYLQNPTPKSITIRWRTDAPTNSRVRYSTSASNLNRTADSPALTREHSVTITGLAFHTRYYYNIGSFSEVQKGGPEYYFLSYPDQGHPVETRIWVLGDSGTADANSAAVRDSYYRYSAGKYTNVILLLGNNAYPAGRDADYQKALFDFIPEKLRQTSVWPTIGNLDVAGAANVAAVPYHEIFSLPKLGESGGAPSGTENYYSFNYGYTHFICLDSEISDRSPSGAMMTWLRRDLSANKNPWIIAFWHHAPYSKGNFDSDVETHMIEMRRQALPILEDYGVDLVLAAHSNTYERSFFLNGHYGPSGSLTSGMIVNHGSGRPDGSGAYAKGVRAKNSGAVYAVVGSSGRTGNGPLNHRAMFQSMSTLGSVEVYIKGNRMDVKLIRSNGTVGDYFTLEKNNRKPSVYLSANATKFTAPATIELKVDARDADGKVRRVRFLRSDGLLLGTDHSKPFSFTWTNVRPGSYRIIAQASDDLDATTNSNTITVTVK